MWLGGLGWFGGVTREGGFGGQFVSGAGAAGKIVLNGTKETDGLTGASRGKGGSR